MCLAIPSRVVEIDEVSKTAVVETFGVKRKVSTMLLNEPLQVGDYVLIHVGFAMEKIDPEEAKKTLELFKELFPEEFEETP
ncbi:MAG TPA: HypC/HybG/HupF family hydrogenase formation chaperone [Aquifex aeolicus]|uniref:HypC/HybG/HupF family hydrogenase formation chaperone n=1 Tax=Aquifex aeolicus TaxID=63363 RepID=A0A9D0YPR7_AQUAO|nr:HypC/HybG/HupF family hydrogenase formation chaperone [Aquificales bacterium]HIP98637.1 HypC/HybG/HupF family hydrogenase formation chaperone [Aquifex aeolicus]HIQ26022.1 HypC/HybG/HupF family hydrogenase formation chaperone [Aquifex aeolicus]